MSTYLTINLAIIIFPFLLSLFPQFRFYRNWRALLFSILTVGALFIAWDVLVTMRGDWAFNPAQISGLKLFYLPLEEWLFFVTVPFSCLFLYNGLELCFSDRPVKADRRLYLILAGASLLAAWFCRGREYTVIVLLVFALVQLMGSTIWRGLFSSRHFWLWSGAGLVLFMIFNYILTALPVVTYNPAAITNLRIATIPIEDFFYNFSMLTLYLGTYLWAKTNLLKK